jgi:Uma2 family endonuclease
MALAHKLMTAEDLLRLPDDGQRHELIAGELRTLPLASMLNGRIAAMLGSKLVQHVTGQNLDEVSAAGTGFQLAHNPNTVLAPDMAFVGRERAEAVGAIEEGFFPGAPDLAVEVISPNDRYTEVEETVSAWLAAGCRMVIVVNPRRRTVTIHRSRDQVRQLTEADTIEGGDVVPGWSLPVAVLFAPRRAQ